MSKRVMIDAGHGGYDPGAVGVNGIKEKDITLNIALKVGDILRKHDIGVMYTRTSDKVLWSSNTRKDLNARTIMANGALVDYFISIHCNSSKNPNANGVETFVIDFGGEAEKLAESVQRELVDITGFSNRGVKKANFHVLRETKMPAILIELGFISNPTEGKSLADVLFQNKCAEAIAKGICNYLGVEVKMGKRSKYFNDIPENYWAIDTIDRVSELGIMGGYSDGTFKPDKQPTRAELATALLNLYRKLGGK